MNARRFPNFWFTANDLPEGLVTGVARTVRWPPADLENQAAYLALTRAVLGSLSLSMLEKNQVFESVLNTWQMVELGKVFAEEQIKFRRYSTQYPGDVLQLSARMVIGAFALAAFRGAGCERVDVERAVIQRMLCRKRRADPEHRIEAAIATFEAIPAAVAEVFGIEPRLLPKEDVSPDGDQEILI